MRYFSFTEETYTLTMNARASVEPLIEVETRVYREQLAQKAEILASDYSYYFQCPPDAEDMAWEALELLLPHMAERLPEHFTLHRDGSAWLWTNHLLDSTTRFQLGDRAALPLPALDWLGRQVQEDLILMAEHPDGDMVCAAGQLCFGSAWSLPDKMGRNFLAIHEAVPFFHAQIGRPSDLMMRRLKPGRPALRWNWSLAATDQLNLAPKLAAQWTANRHAITPENAGDRCYLRLERQTLSRLPRTRAVLFTIHTYLTPVREVVADAWNRQRFASVLRSLPPETRDYKGMREYYPALLAYVQNDSASKFD